MLTANWRDWYHFRHQQAWLVSGTSFEDYVTKVLRKLHDDFINPASTGHFGDGGCDGVAEAAGILYACYGPLPGREAELKLTRKLESDFARALNSWKNFHTWRFITNGRPGPKAVDALTDLQRQHSEQSERPLTLRIWDGDNFWERVVSTLPKDDLNVLFPGAPGIAHLDLADLLPLLETLGTAEIEVDHTRVIRPVPASKMDFNNLPAGSRLELNDGRVMAPRIDRWFAELADPELADAYGQKFKEIYTRVRATTTVPTEILERLYVALAGANFRMDATRSRAAYALISYFFDSCHIFEMPVEEQVEPDVASH